MKYSTIAQLLLSATLALSGCAQNDSFDEKAFADKLDADMEETLADTETLGAKGGQPGLITVSGAIVKSETELEAKITLSTTPGVGKSGQTPALDAKAAPVLKTEAADIDLSELRESKSLLSKGCDLTTVQDIASESNLEIQDPTLLNQADLAFVEANTVVLCGKISEFGTDILNIKADTLILKDASIEITGLGVEFTISTNHLFLAGENKILSKSLDSFYTFDLGPIVNLNVLEDFESTDEATLSLISVGSSYIEKEIIKDAPTVPQAD